MLRYIHNSKRELRQASRDGLQYIHDHMSENDWRTFNQVRKAPVPKFRETAKAHAIHVEVLKDYFAQFPNSRDPRDPDLYYMGGVATSGKTNTLLPRIPERERSVVVDADEFKLRLAAMRFEQQPMSAFFMVNAGQYHQESSRLVDEAIEKARREKRNVIIDSTMSDLNEARNVMRRFKRSKYDVSVYAAQKDGVVAINDAAWRFINMEPHRYVPFEIIASKVNQINKNVVNARNLKYYGRPMLEHYELWDTTERPGKLVYRR